MFEIPNASQRVQLMREAADVQRFHIIRKIGEYSVGQHTFNMLAMLRLVWPNAPTELVWAILEHDLPERLIGDVPSPAIQAGLTDLEATSAMEAAILTELFRVQYYIGLDEELLKWLKALDILELYLFCRDQMRMGNRNFAWITQRVETNIIKRGFSFPPPMLDLFYEIRSSEWDHMPELGA